MEPTIGNEEQEHAGCPRCGDVLVPRDLFTGGRHATVAGCLGCGGQWMRVTDLQRLSEIVEPVLVEWRGLPPSSEQLAVLRCPECPAAPAMEKLQSERDAHVTLDHCPGCGGAWLDAQELRAIQRDSLFSLVAGLGQSLAVRLGRE